MTAQLKAIGLKRNRQRGGWDKAIPDGLVIFLQYNRSMPKPVYLVGIEKDGGECAGAVADSLKNAVKLVLKIEAAPQLFIDSPFDIEGD